MILSTRAGRVSPPWPAIEGDDPGGEHGAGGGVAARNAVSSTPRLRTPSSRVGSSTSSRPYSRTRPSPCPSQPRLSRHPGHRLPSSPTRRHASALANLSRSIGVARQQRTWRCLRESNRRPAHHADDRARRQVRPWRSRRGRACTVAAARSRLPGVALDGKTSRGARRTDGTRVHLLGVTEHAGRFLDQVAVEDVSRGRPLLPELRCHLRTRLTS